MNKHVSLDLLVVFIQLLSLPFDYTVSFQKVTQSRAVELASARSSAVVGIVTVVKPEGVPWFADHRKRIRLGEHSIPILPY